MSTCESEIAEAIRTEGVIVVEKVLDPDLVVRPAHCD